MSKQRTLGQVADVPEPKKHENCMDNEGLFRYLSALHAALKRRFHELIVYQTVGQGKVETATTLRKETGAPRDWAFREWIEEWGRNTWRVAVAPAPPGIADAVVVAIAEPVPDTNYELAVTGSCAPRIIVGPANYAIYGHGAIEGTVIGFNSFVVYTHWSVYDNAAGDLFVASWNNYNSMVAALGLPPVPQVLEFHISLRRRF